MELGRLGIYSVGFLFHSDPGEIEEAAGEVEELGFGALLSPSWNGGPSLFPSLRRLLAATDSLPVVSAIVNVWGNESRETATEFARFEREFPGRFQLGLGIGHPEVEPDRYRRPLATMGAYLDELDQAGTAPRGRRLVAAVGPRMLELAGRRAAGTIPYLVTVEQVRSMREQLGPEAVIAVGQVTLIEDDATVARDLAREELAETLELANYRANLLRNGFEEKDLLDGGSSRLIDAIVAWGDEDAIGRRIEELRQAGATHVWLDVIGVGQALALQQWRRLAPLAQRWRTPKIEPKYL